MPKEPEQTKYTQNHGYVSHERAMRVDYACTYCTGAIPAGEHIVEHRDKAGDLFLLHKRCAAKFGIVWRPIQPLKWRRASRIRWVATKGKVFYEVRLDVKTKTYYCISGYSLVFGHSQNKLVAIAMVEEEAANKNI